MNSRPDPEPYQAEEPGVERLAHDPKSELGPQVPCSRALAGPPRPPSPQLLETRRRRRVEHPPSDRLRGALSGFGTSGNCTIGHPHAAVETGRLGEQCGVTRGEKLDTGCLQERGNLL
jgi:hypothetical protein